MAVWPWQTFTFGSDSLLLSSFAALGVSAESATDLSGPRNCVITSFLAPSGATLNDDAIPRWHGIVGCVRVLVCRRGNRLRRALAGTPPARPAEAQRDVKRVGLQKVLPKIDAANSTQNLHQTRQRIEELIPDTRNRRPRNQNKNNSPSKSPKISSGPNRNREKRGRHTGRQRQGQGERERERGRQRGGLQKDKPTRHSGKLNPLVSANPYGLEKDRKH